MAADVGLQVGHQQRGADPFARNIADEQAEPIVAEIEKVVIVAADLTCLHTQARVVERGRLGTLLWKEPGLHLHGDAAFVGRPSLGFLAIGARPLMCLDLPRHRVDADQHEGVGVRILEERICAPDRGHGRVMEPHAALFPHFELRLQVVCDEDGGRRAARRLACPGFGRRRDERQHRRAIGRCDGDPPFLTVRQLYVGDDMKAEALDEEVAAAILIGDRYGHGMHAQMRRSGGAVWFLTQGRGEVVCIGTKAHVCSPADSPSLHHDAGPRTPFVPG